MCFNKTSFKLRNCIAWLKRYGLTLGQSSNNPLNEVALEELSDNFCGSYPSFPTWVSSPSCLYFRATSEVVFLMKLLETVTSVFDLRVNKKKRYCFLFCLRFSDKSVALRWAEEEQTLTEILIAPEYVHGDHSPHEGFTEKHYTVYFLLGDEEKSGILKDDFLKIHIFFVYKVMFRCFIFGRVIHFYVPSIEIWQLRLYYKAVVPFAPFTVYLCVSSHIVLIFCLMIRHWISLFEWLWSLFHPFSVYLQVHACDRWPHTSACHCTHINCSVTQTIAKLINWRGRCQSEIDIP